MKTKFIILLLITGLYAVGLYENPKRYPTDDYRLIMLKYMSTPGRDSTFTLSFDSLKQYVANENIGDSIAAVETRTITRSDSLSTDLRLAMRDSSKQVWIDSSGQANLVIPNNLTVHGTLTASSVYAGSEILAEKSFITGNYTANDSSVCVIRNGDSLFVRTVFDNTRDLIETMTDISTVPILGYNKIVKFNSTYLIPNTNPYTRAGLLTSGANIKNSSDDNAPFRVGTSTYNTLLGGNHGLDVPLVTVANGHGLTTADIGDSTYHDWTNHAYIPVQILTDSTMYMLSPVFDSSISGNLWNGSDSLIIKSYTTGQLKPSINNTSKYCYVDSMLVSSNGVYYGKRALVSEYYDIADPVACLDSLIAHAGEVDNTVVNLGIPAVGIKNTYEFYSNSECNINTDISIKKSTVTGIGAGITQYSHITQGSYDSIYVYVPGTKNMAWGAKTYYGSKLNDVSSIPVSLSFTSSYWSNAKVPPSRFYEFAGTTQHNLDVGFVAGYNTTIGNGKNYNRKSLTYSHVLSETKMYPYAFYNTTVVYGQTYTVQAYRQFFKPHKFNSNTIASYIHRDNDNYYLEVESQGSYIANQLTLPMEYSNYNVSAVNVNDSITSYSKVMNTNKFTARLTGNSSGSFLLNKNATLPSYISDTSTKSTNLADTLKISGITILDGSKTYTSGYGTNTRLGLGTLAQGTGASNNTAIGYMANNSNTYDNNTVIGANAMLNGPGEGNTLLGVNVLTNAFAASSYNTIIGCGSAEGSLFSSDLSGLSLLGYQSGYSLLTGGNYNNFLGYQSGYSNTTGENNIFLGRKAGYNNTAYKYTIAIGDSTVVTADSTLAIGHGNDPLLTGNMTVGVANRGLTIDGTLTAQYVKSDSLTWAKMLFSDETPVAVELGGDDTWTRFNGLNTLVMSSRGNISKTSKSIVITEAGTYSVICSASLGCDQGTANIHVGIAKNNTVGTYAQVEYSSKDAGDVNDVTIPNLPELVVGDSLYLMVKSDSQSDSLRIKHLNFIVKRQN